MYRALINFSGIISMNKGEIREISNKDLANKLIKANLIEEVSNNKPKSEIKATKNKKS